MKYKFSFMILTEANQVVVKSDSPAFVMMLRCEPVGNDIDGRVYSWSSLRRVFQLLKQQRNGLAVYHRHIWMDYLQDSVPQLLDWFDQLKPFENRFMVKIC